MNFKRKNKNDLEFRFELKSKLREESVLIIQCL